MYAEFFGFRELPFNNTPDPRFFYSTPDHEEALASLAYTVQERKGFVLLTGEVGTGKTLISRLMLRQFGSQISFAHINHAVPSAADLLEAICTELEINVEPASTIARVIRRLHDHLLARFAQDVPVVLVLDEAQNLPDEAFELIRTIGNLEADDAKLLQIVIVGQPELQERFASPQLRQLRQRVFRSFHLSALSRPATEAYIRFRLQVAGGSRENLFDSEAVDRIFEYSNGLPRLINTLCDNALLSAYSADRKHIDGSFLQGVVSQLMMSTKGITHGEHSLAKSVSDTPSPKRPVLTSNGNTGGDGRETFEKLSRIVDVLESRVSTSGHTPANQTVTANGHRELEAAAQRARDIAERVLREAADREQQSRRVTRQLGDVLTQIRTSYEGVRTLCGEATALKDELTRLYDRLGARVEEMRSLLAQRDMAKSKPREQILRHHAIGPTAASSSTGRISALQNVARGVTQLQSLVSERKSGRGALHGDRPFASASSSLSAERLAREVNQLLAKAS